MILQQTGLLQNASAPSGGGTPSFTGDAYNATALTTQTLNSTSPNQTALPATFPAGTYILAIGSMDELPTSVTIDGTSATQKVGTATSSQSMSVWEATISGGGTGDIVANFTTAQRIAVAVWEAGGKVYNSGMSYERQLGSTTFPVNDDGTTNLSTSAGDAVFCGFISTDSALGAWTGLTGVVTPITLGSRYFVAAWTSSAAGGNPETMNITMSATFKWSVPGTVVYR